MNESLKNCNIFTVLTILFGCCLFGCKDQPSRKEDGGYKTMKVALGDIILSNSYAATIKGIQDVEIRPQVSGRIMEIRMNEGADVKRGQTMFVIDQVPYQAALATAIANVNSARAKVATAKLLADSKQELYNQNVVSEFDLQTARNSLMEAEAVLEQAKAAEIQARNDLSYTEIQSPLDGVSGMTPYKVGTLVSSSIATPLTTVSDIKEVYAYFSLTENQLLALSRQNKTQEGIIESIPEVELLLSDGSVYGHKGKIDAISGMVDTQTGAVSIRASFPNPERMLRSGGTATVVIPHVKTGCIIIPQIATFDIQNKTYVYKVVENKTQSVAIEVFPINNGKEYIVEAGLKPGDVIIAEGVGFLSDGIHVDTQSTDH
ncbi:MAG: efflux RND transporter periplasmic adaptor subunit [Bacteroides xylanisolvens]